jgi:hypothetical protein
MEPLFVKLLLRYCDQTITCPNGQRAEVTPGRKEDRYRAAFEAVGYERCPFLDSCPIELLKCTPERVLAAILRGRQCSNS